MSKIICTKQLKEAFVGLMHPNKSFVVQARAIGHKNAASPDREPTIIILG